jgi:hypothetical protein
MKKLFVVLTSLFIFTVCVVPVSASEEVKGAAISNFRIVDRGTGKEVKEITDEKKKLKVSFSWSLNNYSYLSEGDRFVVYLPENLIFPEDVTTILKNKNGDLLGYFYLNGNVLVGEFDNDIYDTNSYANGNVNIECEINKDKIKGERNKFTIESLNRQSKDVYIINKPSMYFTYILLFLMIVTICVTYWYFYNPCGRENQQFQP